MKVSILVIAISLLAITQAYAQAPQAFSYQAVARDEVGNILADQAISVKIALLDSTSTVLYEETHQDTTNAFGAFRLAIGQGTPVTGTFSNIDWSQGGAKFLQISLDPEGGDNFVEVGTTQLLSVPYALYAENSVWTRNGDDIFYNQGYVGIGSETPDVPLHIHDGGGRSFTRYTTDQTGQTNTNDGLLVGTDGFGAWVKNGENTPLILFTSDIPRMIISGDGKVSIGSQSPTHELHLLHKSTGDGGASAGLKIQNEGNNDNWWALYTANGSGQFELYYKGTIKGRFKPSDGTYEKGSDARLKRDIEPLTPTLQKVLELTPRTYYFKDDKHPTSRSLGFIAQEVQPVFPELVGYAGEEQDIMTLNYDGFSVLAIKAIQEQQAEIERNKYLIDQLRKRITALESKSAE